MTLLGGDCLKQLKGFEINTFDSLVTDPPAGISFMGKEWDDDKGGRKQWIAWMQDVMIECLRVMKPGAHGLVWAIPRTSHWTATALEEAGFEIRDVVTHLFGSGFPKSLDVSKAIDKSKGAETLPATDLAKEWNGWGTALKPASEHWILIRKPLSEKTVAKNVERWGTGGINIDGCRIERSYKWRASDSDSTNFSGSSFKTGSFGDGPHTQGRFPANLILSHHEDCKEDWCVLWCPGHRLDEQSGPCKTGALTGQPRVENKLYGKAGATLGKPMFYQPDSATGASRFFYCAKASKKDRNAGLEGMPVEHRATIGRVKTRIENGVVTNERKAEVPNPNTHPTVKPTKLMEYLITLITPKGGKVLDPFMGSGSTGVAAKRLGFHFFGIEQNVEYLMIAEKRISAERHYEA